MSVSKNRLSRGGRVSSARLLKREMMNKEIGGKGCFKSIYDTAVASFVRRAQLTLPLGLTLLIILLITPRTKKCLFCGCNIQSYGWTHLHCFQCA